MGAEEGSGSEQARSIRQAPFAWQSVEAIREIRKRFTGKERATALAIYMTLTELSNEARSPSFKAFRGTIAERSGTGARTVDRYAEIFKEIGLLHKTLTGPNGANGANVWTLTDPPESKTFAEEDENVTDSRGAASEIEAVEVDPEAPERGAANDTQDQQPRNVVVDTGRSSHSGRSSSSSNRSFSRRRSGSRKRSETTNCPDEQDSQSFNEKTFNGLPIPEGVPEDFADRLSKKPTRDVVEIFFFWIETTQPKNRYLTPSRARTIQKGLAEKSVSECKQAIRGMLVWQRQRGGDLQLSRVFQSRPGGKPLGEHMEFFIEQGRKQPSVSKKIPSADSALISRKLAEMQRAHGAEEDSIPARRAREAEKWLQEQGVEIERMADGYPILRQE